MTILYRKISQFIILCVCFLLLSGCWSAHNLQDQHYFAALGIDYDGENFFLYGQTINFTNVARTESVQSSPPDTGTYVGVGKGVTLNMAAANLYQTAQVKVKWGHVQTVLITRRAIEALDSEIVERLYRFPDNRYTTWLYITENPIIEILSLNSFFNLTSLYTILHNPIGSFKQYSELPPKLMLKYIADSGELGKTSYIPVIGINNEQWTSDDKPFPTLFVTGAFFSDDAGHTKLFTKQELHGYNWLDKRMGRAMEPVIKNGEIYASLTFTGKKAKIKPIYQDGKVKFDIDIKLKGTMHEYIKEMSYEEVIELTKKKIQDEIIEVYNLGIENDLDLFNLMIKVKRSKPDIWKSITMNGSIMPLDQDSINDIHIDILLPSNGKYKRQIQ